MVITIDLLDKVIITQYSNLVSLQWTGTALSHHSSSLPPSPHVFLGAGAGFGAGAGLVAFGAGAGAGAGANP